MNRSYRILPVYTGDVSGVCSALYELGGMVVIHDPSGCNSTYNTHDETRWYDRDSLIFITGLTERDAILGNDEKLVSDTVDAALSLRPRFIALCSSPIPFITGTDLPALARLIEDRTGLPCFHVPANGMHDYTVGAGNAFLCLAKRFVAPAEKKRGTLNILGMTPLDFGVRADPGRLRAFAEEAGFSVRSLWAMDDGLDALAAAAAAEVDLVVSASGLPAARYLWERFGIPYVAGLPIGAFRRTLAEALHTAARTGQCAFPCRDARTAAPGAPRSVIGEPVTMGSLAAAAELSGEKPLRLLCPVEADGALLSAGDARTDGEEEIEALLKGASLVIADPLYAPVCPAGARLVPLPHQAFSGRNGWKTAAELTSLDPAALLA